ncbi:MAG: Nif3-like dinuclear metal center hexameric protein [Bacteroidetes bacterium]|nr:Nif3-like dinuclear metal center hexameric protein [Bacteroidota bacterium]
MRLVDVIRYFETQVSGYLQEDYDNSGLITGNPEMEIEKALICLDVTDAILDEAIRDNVSLVISHHPLIFSGIRKLNSQAYPDRVLIRAIKHDIAIFAIHTNLDNQASGVNFYLAKAMGLENLRILAPRKGLLRKLVVFCPVSHAENVRNALFMAGAGHIGQYDSCSFNLEGQGTFRAGPEANPFVGETGKLHRENEIRIETLYPVYLEQKIVKEMLLAHPYEEVAYDVYPIENKYDSVGAGMIGELPDAHDQSGFLEYLKNKLALPLIRHSPFTAKKIKKVAICGGSGSFLLKNAVAAGAHAFITSDIKYHQFFDADKNIFLADIGHYESERFTKDLIFDLLKKKFPNFAVRISEINTNPVRYFS